MAQQINKPTEGTFLLKGGTLHTVTNGNTQADLLIKDGKIADIGQNLSASGATVIDCSGKHVYPGMIDGGTNLGMSEVGSVSLTNDFNEIGDVIPHMQALTAVNPNATAIPVTRTNGVTSVIVQPSGGLMSGTSSLINLIGYTPEQMYAGFSAVRVNFPASGRRGRRDNRSEEDIKKDAEKALKNLNDVWEKALLYARIDSAGTAASKSMNDYNPQMDALVPVVRGEMPMMIEVNAKADISAAIKWVKEKGADAIFTGVSEGWRVADELAESNIPVITGPVLSIPGRQSDRYDAAYANAGKMQKAGVKVAIRTNDTENVRNLPFNAGFAAAYGMGVEEALKAVTIVPAEIFGVADQLGSLEKGKIANLFVSDGDPFETKSNIEKLFINGWSVPVENRHTYLYDEFLNRTPGLQK
jgi:imidazolonepropionase-like amidohydrolase